MTHEALACSTPAEASLSAPSATGAHRPSATNRWLHALLVIGTAAGGLMVGRCEYQNTGVGVNSSGVSAYVSFQRMLT